jgi:hypothetical protein
LDKEEEEKVELQRQYTTALQEKCAVEQQVELVEKVKREARRTGRESQHRKE